MRKEEKSYKECFNYVKGKRSCIRPNEGFILQLQDYEKILGNK